MLDDGLSTALVALGPRDDDADRGLCDNPLSVLALTLDTSSGACRGTPRELAGRASPRPAAGPEVDCVLVAGGADSGLALRPVAAPGCSRPAVLTSGPTTTRLGAAAPAPSAAPQSSSLAGNSLLRNIGALRHGAAAFHPNASVLPHPSATRS